MSGPEAPLPSAQAAARARQATLLAMAVLGTAVALALLRSLHGWTGALLGALILAPLAAPLPGILRRQRRTFAWATLCLTPYLIYGVTESVSNPSVRWIAAVVLMASLAMFVALVAYLRLTRDPHTPDQSR
ncbi:MAG TPA: DUF2069 domain-containing protein [Steroidobacteraceae bacterium]|nr:DUF2069 domain-containing protein [Steroidobacteraceae bacterium]